MAIVNATVRAGFKGSWLYCHSITILDIIIYTKYRMAIKSRQRALAYPDLFGNIANNGTFSLQVIDFKAKKHCHFTK